MADTARGLGRGLDALLKGFHHGLEAPEVILAPMEKIRPNPGQPRRDFGEESLAELAESIKKSGVLQPILVRPLKHEHGPAYELVAGERRLRAGQMAGLGEIPAIVKDFSDEEGLTFALIENLQREDLNSMEEAVGLERLRKQFDLTQEDLAGKLGKSRPAVANSLRLLQLPEDIQEDVRSGRLSAGHGRALLAVTDTPARTELHARILEREMSVRQAEAQAAYWKKTKTLPGAEIAGKRKAASRGPDQEEPREVAALRKELKQTLRVEVRIQGGLSKGRLVLEYGNEAELAGLLDRLGVRGAPPSRKHETNTE